MKLVEIYALAIALLAPQLSYSQIFGPSTYEECITDSMKGVTSDVAARAIIGACRTKFPDASREFEPSGYFVDARGVGICSVVWNGDEFIANVEDRAREGYAAYDIATPSTIVVRARIPEAIRDDIFKNGETDGNDRLTAHIQSSARDIMRACERKQIFPGVLLLQ